MQVTGSWAGALASETFAEQCLQPHGQRAQELDNILRTLNEAPVSYREAPVMMGPPGEAREFTWLQGGSVCIE